MLVIKNPASGRRKKSPVPNTCHYLSCYLFIDQLFSDIYLFDFDIFLCAWNSFNLETLNMLTFIVYLWSFQWLSFGLFLWFEFPQDLAPSDCTSHAQSICEWPVDIWALVRSKQAETMRPNPPWTAFLILRVGGYTVISGPCDIRSQSFGLLSSLPFHPNTSKSPSSTVHRILSERAQFTQQSSFDF